MEPKINMSGIDTKFTRYFVIRLSGISKHHPLLDKKDETFMEVSFRKYLEKIIGIHNKMYKTTKVQLTEIKKAL